MLGTCSGLFKSPPICELFEFPAWKLRTVVRNDYIRYPIVCKGGFKLGDDFTTVASQSLPILSNSWQLEDSPFHQGWIDHRQSFARAFLGLDAVSVALWYCPFYVLGMNCNLQSDLLSVHSCLASTGCCTLFVCSIQFPRWLSWILLQNSHFVIFDENFVSVIDFFFETPVWSCINKYFMFVVRPSLFGQLCNCLKGWICFCCFLKLFRFLHWNWKVGYQEMDLHFSFSIRYPLISVSGLQVGSV